MPLFMDRHDLENATAEGVAHAHAKDLAVQDKHGVVFHTYWFDARSCSACCLIEAPDAESVIQAHQASHGLTPAEIIEVDPKVVEGFLGRLSDPQSVVHSSKPIDESAIRVVMFTDIVGSTDMTAELGDARALDLVRAHDGIVRRTLAANAGREVKHLGDGIMASFADPISAVKCACDVQRAVVALNKANSSNPLYVRIGLHLGEPVRENNDLFGSTVQLASRICADAAIDAVVISSDLRQAIGDSFTATSLGRRVLKGFKEPLQLFSVDWSA